MKRCAWLTLATLLLTCGMGFAGELKSGPQPGKGIGSFYPTNILNCEDSSKNGTEACLV